MSKAEESSTYRPLYREEIEILEKRGSTALKWSDVYVKDGFDPRKVSNSRFYGRVYIGRLDDIALETETLVLPVGIYESTVVNSRLGDNVALYKLSYLSGYLIGELTLIKDVNELSVTSKAFSFGEIEVVNENGGRAIFPFEQIRTPDAQLMARERGRTEFIEKCRRFSGRASARYASGKNELSSEEAETPPETGNLPSEDELGPYKGVIASSCLIHGLGIGRDVRLEEGGQIEGALSLDTVHIRSSKSEPSEIGSGVELAYGIVGRGVSIESGAKAHHFVLADHSALNMGARVSHIYLGENSTISCCEVAHALMLPFHEQHHNSSFLIAALVEGQSNIAAGATIGSNHSSRKPDGEIICRRGFWPALTVSIKHPSFFASFTLLAKNDYPHELRILLPFSLVSRSETDASLLIIPAFWFLYNRYALERNRRKYRKRDKRPEQLRRLPLAYEPLLPDTAEEILEAMDYLAQWTAEAWIETHGHRGLPQDTLPQHIDTLPQHLESEVGPAPAAETDSTTPTHGTPAAESADSATPTHGTPPAGTDSRLASLSADTTTLRRLGLELLRTHPEEVSKLKIKRYEFERSKNPTSVLKPCEGYYAYYEALHLYAAKTLASAAREEADSSGSSPLAALEEMSSKVFSPPSSKKPPSSSEKSPSSPAIEKFSKSDGWINLGGTLFKKKDKEQLISDVESGVLDSWSDVHRRYEELSDMYHDDIIEHAFAILLRLGLLAGHSSSAEGTSSGYKAGISSSIAFWSSFFSRALEEQESLLESVRRSREKDFTDSFRTSTFLDEAEQEAVMGSLSEEPFLEELREETERWKVLFSDFIDDSLNEGV